MRPAAFLLALVLLAGTLSAQERDTPADHAAFAALDKTMEAAPPDQRLAYNALIVAFIAFRDAHLRHETCPGPTNCPQLQAAERTQLNREFVVMAQGFSPNTPPVFKAEELAAEDDTLNLFFRALSGILGDSCSTSDCLSKSTFQEVERDWIRYRDAWVTFGMLRFPAISSDTWRTYLTRRRNAQLLKRFPILKST
jgi:hypothetical protein